MESVLILRYSAARKSLPTQPKRRRVAVKYLHCVVILTISSLAGDGHLLHMLCSIKALSTLSFLKPLL
jgi:hypothetical protein